MPDFQPNRAVAALLAGASIVSVVGSAGCGMGPFQRKRPARPFVPPAVGVRTMPELTPPVLSAPPEIGPVQFELTMDTGERILLAAALPELPKPPAPPLPSVSKPKPPATVATVDPPPPAAERPKLAPIFTQEQASAYNKEIDQKLEKVRGVLAAAAGKKLSRAQQETVEQIRSLQTLAEQARRQDLLTAVEYARRAEVLANDLAGRLP